MPIIFGKAIVEKRNVLNELRSYSMSLQELRFFSIYLSKINPYDIKTRVVRFPLDDFRKIMGISADMNINHFKYTVRHILQQIVEVPNEGGSGYKAFQLFKEAVIEKDEKDIWYVEFDAHDNALPLMFEFKNKYFTYELWNALKLKSTNQIRMYEILKQYESVGKRELTVTELRDLLGIDPKDYAGRTGWSDFKKKVLDSCQQALRQTTDICYTYERGKVGQGGKWLSIVFNIMKNTECVDKLSLEDFIGNQTELGEMPIKEIDAHINASISGKDIDYGSDFGSLLGSAALNDEFDIEQVRVIQDLVLKAAPTSDQLEMCNYLIGQVHKMDTYKPKNRFKYLCKMLEADIDDE